MMFVNQQNHQTTDATLRDTKPLVAVINTNEETIALLSDVLTDEGFATVTAYIPMFKQGLLEFRTFIAQHQPCAVVYDIALPYVENWHFFQAQVLGLGLLPDACFVLTTTNYAVLEQLVGPTPAIELIGRPFDLDRIIEAVKHAIRVVSDSSFHTMNQSSRYNMSNDERRNA